MLRVEGLVFWDRIRGLGLRVSGFVSRDWNSGLCGLDTGPGTAIHQPPTQVSLDELEEKIRELEDYVQNVDIAAMQKI